MENNSADIDNILEIKKINLEITAAHVVILYYTDWGKGIINSRAFCNKSVLSLHSISSASFSQVGE